MAKVVRQLDPFTVVVLEGIRLPTYAAGGVNISVGDLSFVDHADVHVMGASGAGFTSGVPFIPFVSSGSGNIVTIQLMNLSGPEALVQNYSSIPLSVTAWGH